MDQETDKKPWQNPPPGAEVLLFPEFLFSDYIELRRPKKTTTT